MKRTATFEDVTFKDFKKCEVINMTYNNQTKTNFVLLANSQRNNINLRTKKMNLRTKMN